LAELRSLVEQSGSRELQYTYRFLRKECCSCLSKTCALLSLPQDVAGVSKSQTISSARNREAFVFGPSEQPANCMWDPKTPLQSSLQPTNKARVTSRVEKGVQRLTRHHSPPNHRSRKLPPRQEYISPVEGTPTSPRSTTTSHLVQRFRTVHTDVDYADGPGTGWRAASPHSAASHSMSVDQRSSQASLVTGGTGSTANARSDVTHVSHNTQSSVSHKTQSSATSQQSSLPLSSLPARTTDSQPSSASLSILPGSTILSSLRSNPSEEYSLPSSLAGSASPPIF
jgi:hypothetical protein